MTYREAHEIQNLPDGCLYGFNPVTKSEKNYRWSTPCAGVHLRFTTGLRQIRIQTDAGRRRFNVWQDMDAFIGTVRLDHHHVAFDSTSGTIELTIPKQLFA
ncbi:MAG: hypothetical protein R3330_15390, partial [Saprospiraceae bacterium]|nr:hypothetical protein [Saprospiraceae bacterium]